MVEKRITAREALHASLVLHVGGGWKWTMKDILSDYYISRKKPLTHKETPAERARRTTPPPEFKGEEETCSVTYDAKTGELIGSGYYDPETGRSI